MTSAQTRTLIAKLDNAAASHLVAPPIVLLLKQASKALTDGLSRLMAEESRLVGAQPMSERWHELHPDEPFTVGTE